MHRLFKVLMNPSVKDEVGPVLDSGYIGEGPKVQEFENKLKERFDNDYVLSTNSATSAEHLIFHLLKEPATFTDRSDNGFNITGHLDWPGLQEGDEVLSCPLTCTATNWPILANGLDIKWVDVDPNTMNMDLTDLERKITAKTKLIMLVHWGGYPVNMDIIREIQVKTQHKFGFWPLVIQDCAHAFRSTYKGTHLANLGHISTFSFQAIKHLTCGDGGALALPYLELYNRAKLVRWYGIDRETNRKDFRCEGDIKEYGFKFHMNDISATIGLSNLEIVDKHIDATQRNAARLNEGLKNVPGITLLENKKDRVSSYWIYTLKIDPSRRQAFVDAMKKASIEVSRVHERNDKHTCVDKYRVHLPALDQTVQQMMCIPVGWWLGDSDIDYIIETIKGDW